MSITVQPLQAEDRPAWEALYYGYATFYQAPMNTEILDTVWSWIFDTDNAFYCLLAKDETGQAVGLMHYRAMPSPLRGGYIGFLDDLFVQPDHRGTGAVRALYDQLNAEAKAHGWPIVRWITADNNYRARGLYDQLAEKTQWNTYQMDVK